MRRETGLPIVPAPEAGSGRPAPLSLAFSREIAREVARKLARKVAREAARHEAMGRAPDEQAAWSRSRSSD